MWHKLPNVHRVKAKGKFYYYHRPTRTKLPDDPDSIEFATKLKALNKGVGRAPKVQIVEPEAGSLLALIRAYKTSSEWDELSDRSRADYQRYIDILGRDYGDLQVSTINREAVTAMREVYRATPRKANYLIQVLSILLSFAVDRPSQFGLLVNPALRSKKLKTGKGNQPWPDEFVAWFLGLAPPELLTPFMLGLYTGQREADVLKMTWHDYKDGVIKVVQNKHGDEAEELWIPCHADLRRYLDSLPRRAIHICIGQRGRPYTVDGFKTVFFRAIPAFGLTGMTFHGLRHTATGKLAEAGCSDAEIQAITGHRTLAMVVKYRRRAAQKRMAKAAMARWEQEQNGGGSVKPPDDEL